MDLNDDGYGDILSGSYSRPGREDMAGLLQVLYGNADGDFAKAEVLNGTDDEPLIIPKTGENGVHKAICTRPTAVDWDGDGDLDIVSGNMEGSFFLFTGLGSGKFEPTPATLQTSNGSPLLISGRHSDPAIVDWDRDGDFDILSGSGKGGVSWAENLGNGVMSGFQSLIEAAPRRESGTALRVQDLDGPLQSTRVWVADVDGDEKLDLLIGDVTRLVEPVGGLSDGDMQARYRSYMQEMREWSPKLREVDHSTEEGRAVYQAYRDFYSSRDEFMKENKTGFIWFFRQK